MEQNRRRVLYAFFSALLALGVNQVLNHAWFRERPYVNHHLHRLLPVSQDPSFPGDHAAGVFSIAGSIALGAKIEGSLLMAVSFLIVLSRVYVGLHYPSDVLSGMFIGLMSSFFIERNKALFEKPVVWLLGLWNFLEGRLPISTPGKAIK